MSYLARTLTRLSRSSDLEAAHLIPIEPRQFVCSVTDIATLLDLGFTGVVFHGPPHPHRPEWQALLMVLGTPTSTHSDTVVWNLQEKRTEGTIQPCPLDPNEGDQTRSENRSR